MRVRFLIMAVLLIAGLLTSLFATNKLTRFCLYTPLKVLLVGLVLSLLLWFLSDYVFTGADVKKYMGVNNKDLFFYPFFVCFSCALASYSIFFCKIRYVRDSWFLSFCCFFILPLFLSFWIVSPQIQSKEYYMQTACYAIAFLLPQIYFYIDFCRQNKRGVWDK